MRSFWIIALCVAGVLVAGLADSRGQGRKDPAYKPQTFDGFVGYAQYLEVLRKYSHPLPGGNTVLVIGRVENPGEIAYGDGITVSKAIADAGGFAKFADRQRVAVWKCRDGWFVPVNLDDVIKKKAGEKDPVLEGGDVVVVMQKIIGF